MSKKHGTVKIAVMGNFNPKQNPANGQTIKTKIITSELSSQFEDVLTVDTSGNKIATLIKTPFLCLKALKRSKNVLILPAQNGLRLIAPILAILNSLFHRKLHYVVIGGWLPQFIKQHKYLIKHLKKFEGIYVETAIMKSSLSEHGFNNIYVMPNCKKLDILSESELVYNNTAPLKLCTFSRVMKQKGIEDAVNAVKAINEKHGKTVFSLDIFGQVDPDQTEWFDNLQQAFPDYITYGGV
ncbi:MAG: glycosyltransferase, partial [Oscillospiraceae bacterium]|nr:glycosyltransferase [Candidatus Equicaccousia limihippi]